MEETGTATTLTETGPHSLKIYTKRGDDGTTGLLYGGRVPKDDPATDAYGTTDEAVAVIGLARALGPRAEGLPDRLLRIQRDLFVVGAELATAPENAAKLKVGLSKVTPGMVEWLEEQIDAMTATAPLPNYFVVPGSSEVSAVIDVARSVIRRAERAVVGMKREGRLADEAVLLYLNRLSDFLFVSARYEEHARGIQAPPSHETPESGPS
ncbi:MAG: cob(I)yrinic acid a,c-diamide adenosyltransferase [Actinomycetota bacterium]